MNQAEMQGGNEIDASQLIHQHRNGSTFAPS